MNSRLKDFLIDIFFITCFISVLVFLYVAFLLAIGGDLISKTTVISVFMLIVITAIFLNLATHERR